jgi:RNA polymerase sigma-70 factor (ECF subfamily)
MSPAPRDSSPALDGGAVAVNQAGLPASKRAEGTDPADDRDLVRRVQVGDQEAFRTLFERYHRRAYAVAFGVLKNKQDALDVVQDGFVKVHRHIDKFQGTSSFYTWLYRIIMNLAIDHVRRRRNAKGCEYDDKVGRNDDEVAGDGTLLPRILDANPGKTVIRRELLERIQNALDELPEHHRAVILLREVEGLSYEEMAEVLDVPKGTIMSRLFHARKKMQAALSDYMEGDLEVED